MRPSERNVLYSVWEGIKKDDEEWNILNISD